MLGSWLSPPNPLTQIVRGNHCDESIWDPSILCNTVSQEELVQLQEKIRSTYNPHLFCCAPGYSTLKLPLSVPGSHLLSPRLCLFCASCLKCSLPRMSLWWAPEPPLPLATKALTTLSCNCLLTHPFPILDCDLPEG